MRKQSTIFLLLVILVVSVIGIKSLPADAAIQSFVDVPPDDPYFPYIEALYRLGYVSGCSENPLKYCPYDAMERSHSAVFVERGINSAEFIPSEPTEVVFADVALGAWYGKWIHGLWDDQFTSGCGTNPLIYCPDQLHTRAEGSVFFLRMMYGADYEPPEAKGYFADVDYGKWYGKWVDAAWGAGIAEPCATEPDLQYCADEPLTRAVAAYMMVKAKDLTPYDPGDPTPLTLGPEIVLGDGTSPDIAVDSQGNLHIVYDADSGGITYVMVNSDRMEAPISLDANGGQPRVTIDNQDNPHIAWVSSDNVYYTKRQDDGSFVEPLMLYDFPDRTEKIRIAVDQRDNRAFVMYEHVGEKESSDPEISWVFFYTMIDNSGPIPVAGPRVHPPTDRTYDFVEQSGGAAFDDQGTVHYAWRDWGGRGGGERGLHYQTMTTSGQYSADLVLNGSVSDFVDLALDSADNVHIITTTAWSIDGLLYATNRGGSWSTVSHYAELFAKADDGSELFDPDLNVPAITYDSNKGLVYMAFTGGENYIHHSYQYIKSYVAYVDLNGNFSEAMMLHDEDRGSGGKYNGVRIAPATNKGVFAVIPVLREGVSSGWEIVLLSVGGAVVGSP